MDIFFILDTIEHIPEVLEKYRNSRKNQRNIDLNNSFYLCNLSLKVWGTYHALLMSPGLFCIHTLMQV